jgi:hypothetical protein
LLIAWALSPFVAYWISQPSARTNPTLERTEQQELRRLARKTWAFFEAFVTPEEHWLPPDNFQEYPKDKIAHRVSPTNEGLFIVSAAAAHDFGFLGLCDLVTLLERNLQTLEQLERHPARVVDVARFCAPVRKAAVGGRERRRRLVH